MSRKVTANKDFSKLPLRNVERIAILWVLCGWTFITSRLCCVCIRITYADEPVWFYHRLSKVGDRVVEKTDKVIEKPTSLTEIHAHVLFDIDDGPSSLEQSLNLLSVMKAQGVQRVFCTSHYKSPHFSVEKKTIEQRFEALSETIDELPGSYPILKPAAEVRLSPELIDDIRSDDVPTLGETPYVLIEFPGTNIPEESLNMVHELKVRGYKPIMAHPERNLEIQHDPQLVDTLVSMDISLQLTAGCLTKKQGKLHPADALAWEILKRGRAAVIASDSHDTKSRPPTLAAAYENIASELGSETANMLKMNANSIWQGQPVECIPAIVPKRSFPIPFLRNRREKPSRR
ncbi:tyrosine-protein phosphatase [Alicyclobacillus sp. SO9]|uniref:tyrosine-protein phosphatase n=1 Tax=Alicyclobacillus sp. SO9 TaxID=2665646 RepID=UPI0018E884B4|nr:CpsB/CapC family capsule biosynthesis tyrosine phosphatase [Alicyclobacillus sp. SO9]QQE78634.1 hypothetical protein GI364_22705 [Alicyclobacillus sp. SO9]